MNVNNINQMHGSIVNLLQQSRLKEAQTQAEAIVNLCSCWTLTNQLEQNRTSYNYMLDYMRQGISDPQRENLYLRLRTDLWDIADRARILLLDKVSSHYYHETRRTQALLPPEPNLKEQLAELESIVDDIDLCQLPPHNNVIPDDLRRRHEAASRRLFINVWTSDPWTDEQVDQADLWLESNIFATHEISLLVSAVSMSLLQWFDPKKMQWLLRASVSFEVEYCERALVGVALALLQHGDRVYLYPDLTETVRKHAAEYELGKRLNTVYLQLLRCRETDSINRKMQEEILPTMLQNKDLFRKLKQSLEDEYEGDVPDWAEALDRLGLNDKIREMNDLQMQGKDIYMSTFAPLKSHPFFNDLPNWFRPFDLEHSAIPAELRQSGTFQKKLSLFFEVGALCDSDKYSLTFMLQHLPQAQRDLMFAQLSQEALDELEDNEHLDKLRRFACQPQTISNRYLQDLYRFFKISRYKGQFADPFRESINLYANPVLRIVLNRPELKREIADLFLSEQRWKEAGDIYKDLTNTLPPSNEDYEKAGFCLQKQKYYGQALRYYEKADLLAHGNAWILRHLGTCCRMTERYKEALAYYEQADAIQPGNRGVLYQIANCLADLEEYKEAMDHYFRLDLAEEHSIRAWRGIAWCAFKLERWDTAAKYYDRIPDKEKTARDWLNAGHVALVSDIPANAILLYRHAADKFGDRTEFREALLDDLTELESHGVTYNDLLLIADEVL